MISRSLKMWRGHLLQITDKERPCIDEENSQPYVFPSGEPTTKLDLKIGPFSSLSLHFSLPLSHSLSVSKTMVNMALQVRSGAWAPAGLHPANLILA